MNGRERFLTALRRDVPDAPPVFLRDLTLALDETGYSTPEVCSGQYDAEKSADSVIALHRRLGQDAMVGCVHYVGMEVEALGGKVRFPENGIPSVIEHPFQDPGSELPDLDLERVPTFQNVANSHRLVSEAIGSETAMVCNLEGPITKAALLRGMENLALDMYHDPMLASAYVSYATRLAKDYLEFVGKKARLDCCFVAAASDNPDIFGQEAFLKHSVPNLARIWEASRTLGLPTVFHPHGDLSSEGNRPLIENIIGTGVEGFQFAEGNDHCALKEQCADRIALLGGIDAFTTLLLGPPERIERETRAFINDFHPWDGYVFMCSCSLHRGMPMGNVEHMLRTVRGITKKEI